MVKALNMESGKIEAPYGHWTSPITSEMTIRTDKSGRNTFINIEGENIYWTESRPEENGRTVLMVRYPDGKIEQILPDGFDIRTKVHEYGGLPFAVHNQNIYFINRSDQCLYELKRNEAPRILTKKGIRLAQMQICPWGIVAVAEELITKTPLNYLAYLTWDGMLQILHEGHDFYGSPAFNADFTKISWLTWDHPNMPWDATQLWITEFNQGNFNPAEIRCVNRGIRESIFQPQWSPQGTLYFVSDRNGWWNICRIENDKVYNVYPMEAEFGVPQWLLGTSTWGFTGIKNQILCTYKQKGIGYLALLDPDTNTLTKIDSDFIEFSQITLGSGFAVFLVGSPKKAKRLVRLDLQTLEIEALDTTPRLDVDESYFSAPIPFEFPSDDGSSAYGYFYPPSNSEFQGPSLKKPPVIVNCHGGPTASSEITFSIRRNYFTSRGFAYLELDYSGSTGYGRGFRERLNGLWGQRDVSDCICGIQYLIDRQWIDKDRIYIRGSSSGGLTVLLALANSKIFRGGVSCYGVVDLEMLTKDTHKFEAYYLNSLVDAGQYKARSPITHADKISCPVLFFQGENDKIVPPNQSLMMCEALKARGIDAKLVLYSEEEHGFRKAETMIDTLTKEKEFYLSLQ